MCFNPKLLSPRKEKISHTMLIDESNHVTKGGITTIQYRKRYKIRKGKFHINIIKEET